MQYENNEATSKIEVKNVIKEELIKYLSDIKGSIINKKNRCERYEDIVNSNDKSKKNFKYKFHNKNTSNLSAKTKYLNNSDELNDVVRQCKEKRDINIKPNKAYLINYLSDSAGSRQNNLNRLQRYETIFRNSKTRDKNEYIKSFNHLDVDNIYMATSRLSNNEILDVINTSKTNKRRTKATPNNEEYKGKRREYNNYLAKLIEDEKELNDKYIKLEEIKRNINDYPNIKLNLNSRQKTKRTKKNKKIFYNTYEQTNLEKQIEELLTNKIIPKRIQISKMKHELFSRATIPLKLTK